MRSLTKRCDKAKTAFILVLVGVPLLSIAGCARSPQEKYATFLGRGERELQKHAYQRAILEFKNALQANPKSAEAQYQIALAYLGMNDSRNAVAYLWKTLELDPKHRAAELKLSEMASASRNPDELKEAERHLKGLLAASPHDPDVLNTLAVAEWGLGKQGEAEKFLNEAFTQFPQNLKAGVNLAKIKLSEKDPAGAEAILKKMAENNPGVADAAVILGQFYIATGRRQEAGRQFQRALQIDPKNGFALVSTAALQWQAGQTDEADKLFKKASSLPDPQYKPVHALFLFRSGKREQAIVEFEKLAKENPGDRETRSRLVEAYQRTDRRPDAEKLLSDALQKNPKDVDALMQRAEIYLGERKYAQAQADLTTVLHFRPDSPIAHYLLAHVYQKTGAALRSRQELTEALRLRPDLLSARLELADLLIMSRSAKTALELLNETPESQKNGADVLIRRNWAYLGLGNWSEARKGIDRALQIGHSAEALIQDGALKLAQRNFEAARESFEQALKTDPDNLKALDLLVQTYELQQQTSAAVERVRQYAGQHPNSAPVQLFLGNLLLKSGNREESRKAYATAKGADPSLADTDMALARVDASEGKLDEARKRLSAIIAQTPTDIAPRLLLGSVENSAKNYASAVEQYRAVVQLDDTNVEALNNLAYLLADMGEQYYDEALKLAQKAKELGADNAAVQNTLGWVLCRKGLYALAIPYLEQSVATQPTGMRKGQLALAYLKSGNRRKGLDTLQAALNADPSLARSELMREILSSSRQ